MSREKKDYILVDGEVTIMDWVFLFHLWTRTVLKLSYPKQWIFGLFSLTSTSCSIQVHLMALVTLHTIPTSAFLYFLRARKNRRFCFHRIWLREKMKKKAGVSFSNSFSFAAYLWFVWSLYVYFLGQKLQTALALVTFSILYTIQWIFNI